MIRKFKFLPGTLDNELATGKYRSVMFNFTHGLGDAIDFYCNVLPVLEARYPDIKFGFSTHKGQEWLFGNVSSFEYDLAVHIGFECTEWDPSTEETKAERCLRCEIGIPLKQRDKYSLPIRFGSPLVGTHFFSTSSESLSCEEDVARKIWNRIEERKLIPIDTHFDREDAKIRNRPYPWEHRNVVDAHASIFNLVGLMGALGGFAGVASGNIWTAFCCLPPECILYIETDFPASKLTRMPIWSIKEYDEETVDNWISAIKRHAGLTVADEEA